MLKHGEHRGHGAAEVVDVEGYGYVNGDRGRRAVVLIVAEGEGLPEEREFRERTASNNNLIMLNNFNGMDLLNIKW